MYFELNEGHVCENTNGVYTLSIDSSCVALCLDELLVKPIIEQIPLSDEVSSHEMWENLSVSEYYAEKETIMWDKMSAYVLRGNDLISSIHDNKCSMDGKVPQMDVG